MSVETSVEIDRVLAAKVYAAAVVGAAPEELSRRAGTREVLDAAGGIAVRLGAIMAPSDAVLDRLQRASRLLR